MTPEKKVKNKVVEILDRRNVYYFYPMSGGYGKSGVPDIVGCHKGQFFGIECKAGKNKTTALQEKNLREIDRNQGLTLIINEGNIDMVETMLTTCQILGGRSL